MLHLNFGIARIKYVISSGVHVLRKVTPLWDKLCILVVVIHFVKGKSISVEICG